MTAPTVLRPSPPYGKTETNDARPKADASVGAHAGHPATSADANAQTAAIPECFLEWLPKCLNRYVTRAAYAQKRTAFAVAAAISAYA